MHLIQKFYRYVVNLLITDCENGMLRFKSIATLKLVHSENTYSTCRNYWLLLINTEQSQVG